MTIGGHQWPLTEYLGAGTFGSVWKTTTRIDKDQVVVKKFKTTNNKDPAYLLEIDNMTHAGQVKAGPEQIGNSLYVVYKFKPGKDIFNHPDEEKYYKDTKCPNWMRAMQNAALTAVMRFWISHGIVHL